MTYEHMVTAAAAAGLTTPVIIQGLVKVAKENGLPSKYAAIFAVALGIMMAVPAAIVAGIAWYCAIPIGTGLGLIACGGYSVAQPSKTSNDTIIAAITAMLPTALVKLLPDIPLNTGTEQTVATEINDKAAKQ